MDIQFAERQPCANIFDAIHFEMFAGRGAAAFRLNPDCRYPFFHIPKDLTE